MMSVLLTENLIKLPVTISPLVLIIILTGNQLTLVHGGRVNKLDPIGTDELDDLPQDGPLTPSREKLKNKTTDCQPVHKFILDAAEVSLCGYVNHEFLIFESYDLQDIYPPWSYRGIYGPSQWHTIDVKLFNAPLTLGAKSMLYAFANISIEDYFQDFTQPKKASATTTLSSSSTDASTTIATNTSDSDHAPVVKNPIDKGPAENSTNSKTPIDKGPKENTPNDDGPDDDDDSDYKDGPEDGQIDAKSVKDKPSGDAPVQNVPRGRAIISDAPMTNTTIDTSVDDSYDLVTVTTKGVQRLPQMTLIQTAGKSKQTTKKGKPKPIIKKNQPKTTTTKKNNKRQSTTKSSEPKQTTKKAKPKAKSTTKSSQKKTTKNPRRTSKTISTTESITTQQPTTEPTTTKLITTELITTELTTITTESTTTEEESATTIEVLTTPAQSFATGKASKGTSSRPPVITEREKGPRRALEYYGPMPSFMRFGKLLLDNYCDGPHPSPINIDTSSAKTLDSLTEFEFINIDNDYSIRMYFPEDGTNLLTVRVEDAWGIQKAPCISKGSIIGPDLCFDRFYIRYGVDDKMGSEHQLNGKSFSMELQFFFTKQEAKHRTLREFFYVRLFDYHRKSGRSTDNQNIKGKYVRALSVFVTVDANNRESDPSMRILAELARLYWRPGVDRRVRSYATVDKVFKFKSFFPQSIYYAYKGSLTFPPCFPDLDWAVFEQPIKISRQDFEAFLFIPSQFDDTGYVAGNVRPMDSIYVQLEDRKVNKDEGSREQTVRNRKNRQIFKSLPPKDKSKDQLYDYYEDESGAISWTFNLHLQFFLFFLMISSMCLL